MHSFDKEAELTAMALSSETFYDLLGYEDWLCWQDTEPSGLFGVPDLVLCFAKTNANGGLILRTFAFEMKLHDWKRALTQAYKYTAFAHYSFVVMDHKHVTRAEQHIDLFDRSNVGLISIDLSGRTFIHSRPRFRQPYSQSLKNAFDCRIKDKVTPAELRNVCQHTGLRKLCLLPGAI